MTTTIERNKLTLPNMSWSTALGKDVVFERVASPKAGEPLGTVKGVKVFKTGTFRDSMGRQATWGDEHLQQMAFHFNLLRANGMLPNVPVREDHWSGAAGLIGYVDSLKVDGGFLSADLNITEASGADKIESGTYRGRSLEVGMFEANDESMYWPVVHGLAFVDIPAVEGLFGKDDKKNVSYFIISEAPMSGNENSTFSQAHVDFAIACAYAQGLKDAPSDKAPAMFKINGADSADVAAIQTHITGLETFRKESAESGRKNYVAALAKDGKIAATQVDALGALALTMTDAQFESFKATYDVAPKAALFQQHVDNGNEGTRDANGNLIDPTVDERAILEETVANHKRAGMAQEALEKTNSFKRLQVLNSKSAA